MSTGTKAAERHQRKGRTGRGTGRLAAIVCVLLALVVGNGLVTTHRDASAAVSVPHRTLVHADLHRTLVHADLLDPFTAEAATAAAGLNKRYSFAYVQTQSWQAANALSATIDFMRASGSRAYLSELTTTYLAHHSAKNFLSYFYDDEGWWVLTWIKAYELTGDPAYLQQAKSVFAAMTNGWTQTCGGGVLWMKVKPYKNAITNEEFLQDAVLLHDLTPGDTMYARWALLEWNWLSASGMITSSHLVVDGLSPTTCKPILDSPIWTYNQGTLIGALVSLAAMTGQTSLLTTAEQVAQAVMDSPALSPNGILTEGCTPLCGRDGPMFKGIFMQNLKLLYDRVGGSAYGGYLSRNAAAAWTLDRSGVAFGVNWSGPFEEPSMPAQSSALDLLNTQIPTSQPAP
jgi:predicted alpha-1,6-mannanase (GH76 family)